MDPGENRWIDRNVPSQSELDNEHGGFLYFRHDGSAVIFLIDLDDAIPTPNLGAGSLIRHAFRLCKHQIKMNSISTTCPAIHQSKDKIHRACQDGSKEHLNYLLDENPQNQKQFLLQQDEFGWTPLHYACCHNAQDDELISMLLEKCPDALFIQNNNNLSPIHLACDNNPSVQVIRKLLHYDTDKITLYLKSKHHGLSPLHFACSNSTTSIEVIRLLILSDSSGTTLFEKGIITATSLHTAIAGNHGHEVIDLILRSALNIDSIQTNPLLLERMNGMLPIHLACLKASSSETVSLLLNADHNDEAYYDIVGFCPEYDLMNSSVLHIALDQSTKDVIDLLLIKEVKLRCKPSSKMIDLLDIVEGKTDRLPIHMACARKHLNVKTIKTLVGLKTNSVFCTDKNGNTPLHHICSNTHATYEIIEILLAAEKEYLRTSPKSKEIKSAVKTSNEQMYTPLCLAAQAGVTDAHLLLDPEHICLKGMDWDAKKGLLDLVLQNKSFQDKVVKNLAERQYFLLIMLELIANIVATAVYFTASIRSLDNVQIHPLQTATLISCITIFILRECIQLKGCTFVDYIIDGWNWIEVSSIVALSMATVHMIQLSSNENMLPIRSIFIWSGVLLVMQFIFIIRTTFLPFARFVAGLLTITCTLIPFFVVSGMVLLAFTYSFHMSGGRDEECTSFGICFLWTLGGFFFGQDDFMKTPFIDVLFGILAAVIL
jgi:ankyrin repeat protein